MKSLAGLFFLLSLIVGCTKGSLVETATPQSFTQESLVLLGYTDSQAQLFLQGSILVDGIASFSQIDFYLNSSCSGDILGTTTAGGIKSDGATLTTPLQDQIPIFYKTSTGSDCYFALTYEMSLDPVPVPTLVSTFPESPSKNLTQVAILGEIFPPQATVELYLDSLCATPVASGSSATFLQPGLQVEVTADTVTPVAARTKDPRGHYSECQLLIAYEHQSELTTAIEFLSATPLSPSRTVFNPVLRGRTQSSIVSVTLYSDPACSLSLGQVDSATFENEGLEVNLSANFTNQVYGTGEDAEGSLTACLFVTDYTHDNLPPSPPAYVSADPVTPTRLTTFPKILGTAPDDAAVVRLFSDSLCSQVVGFGTRALFTGVGITANLPANNTTTLFGTALDASGNSSSCEPFVDYKHNTIPPDSPTFQSSVPTSPTNVTASPVLSGTPSQFTSEIRFYDDMTCTNLVGQGGPDDFSGAGIQVGLQENTNNFIYTTVRDIEGNVSACTELTNFDHSNLPAPNPVFTTSFPSSPTRLTTTPALAGSSASTVTSVALYLDSGCASVVGSGSRGNFGAAGISLTVNANAVTPVYAVSTDIYGNTSSCQLLTDFIHSNIPPPQPTYTSADPASPNNVSFTPTLVGSAFTNMASPIEPIRVNFYDNPSCVGGLGEGTPEAYSSPGIQINVAPDAPNSIYARSWDAAGNGSACTFLTNYIHNTLAPGRPLLETLNPESPSYTPLTRVTGSFANSPDFMSRVSVVLYEDTECTQEIVTTTPNIFETVGVDVPVPANATTPLSAASFNGVGNKSICSALVDYNTYDTAPVNLTLISNSNGSVQANWQVDSVADPQANYRLKRSTLSGGPYTSIYAGVGNAFKDTRISEGITYYYVVQAFNSSGQTLNSAEQTVTIDAPSPVAAASLFAISGSGTVTLSWSGFPQNLSYKVYRGGNPGGPYQELTRNLTSNSYSDYSLTNDKAYYYVVTGANPEGDSLTSNEVSAVPRPVPAAPSNAWIRPLNSISECAGGPGIWIQWTEPSHYDSFRVIRRDELGDGFVRDTTESPYVDCNTSTGSYDYFVRSRWGSFFSPVTSAVTFESGQAGLSALSGDGLVSLEWSVDAEATVVDIYRSQKADGPFELLTTVSTSGGYLDNAVTNGEGYYYYIQARDTVSVHYGYPSVVRSANPGTVPGPPSNLVGSFSDNSLNLSWTPPSHYNNFKVFRSASALGPYVQIGTSPTPNYLDFLPPEGMNYYKITAAWGTFETSETNIFEFRRAQIVNLSATDSTSEVELSWDLLTDANSYRVLRSPTTTGPWSVVGMPATNTFTDTSLLSGESYYYKVQPLFADGSEGQTGNSVEGRRTDSFKPGGLSIASQGTTAIGITWIPVPTATEYEVEIATAEVGPYSLAKTSTLTGANLTGLLARTLYYLRVKTTVGGTTYTSEPLQAATLGVVTPPSGTVGDNIIDLLWVVSAGVTSYNLERSLNGVDFSVLASGLTTTSYSDSSAVNGQIYFYRIQHVYDGIGIAQSLSSDSMTPGITPKPPTGLTVVTNTNGFEIELSWARPTGVSLYGIYRATSVGGPYTQIFTTTSASNVNVSGLTSGQLYFFQVTSFKGTIESGPSASISVRPVATPPAPSVRYQSSSEIQLDWSAVTFADTYDILRSENPYNFQTIASGVVATTYTDSSASTDKTYYYKYLPVAASGEFLSLSDLSQLVGTGTTINAPQGVFLRANTVTEVQVNWAPVPQAETFEVFRSQVSGSGFTSIATVLGTLRSWTDTTVSNGQTYYYKVRALNQFEQPSDFSLEANISLVSAPVGLAALNNSAAIDLTWTPLANTSQYLIYRSDALDGSYGFLGSTVTPSYSDTDVIPGTTYFYKISALLDTNVYTPLSDPVSLLKTGFLNLSFPIELLDRPIASSDLSQVDFKRTQTIFDEANYDGSVTYSFEVVAQNTDSSAKSIRVVDENDSLLKTMTIPSGIVAPTRFTESFTVGAGQQTWRLQLEQTTTDSDLIVSQARIIVNQTNATRTAIYIPLLSSDLQPDSGDVDGEVAMTDDSTLQVLSESLPYVRQVNHLDALIDNNPWALEVVVASDPGVIGEAALYNIDRDSPVESTTTEFSQTTPTVIQVPMSNSNTNFSQSSEEESIAITLRCQVGCDAGAQARIYKAGLWVRLENLRKAQVSWRTSLGYTIPATPSYFDLQRTQILLSDFTNPQVFWQASVNTDQTVSLGSASTNDSGDGGGITNLANSQLTGSGSGLYEVLRSPALSPVSGDRYLMKSSPSVPSPVSGSLFIINSQF